jgi:hypothetical protein
MGLTVDFREAGHSRSEVVRPLGFFFASLAPTGDCARNEDIRIIIVLQLDQGSGIPMEFLDCTNTKK